MSKSSLPLYSVAAARTLEQDVRAHFSLSATDLMQRAGESAWAVVKRFWPDVRRIMIVAGPGNNGGDGYVLARCALHAGCAVRVLQVMASKPQTALAHAAWRGYLAAGGQMASAPVCWHEQDVIVDAILGIGMNRSLEPSLNALIAAINESGRPILSLDTPTGVHAETGQVAGSVIGATATVQFLLPHQGLYTGPACDAVGSCLYASLQVPSKALDSIDAQAEAWLPAMIGQRALPPRRRHSHKGDFGQVLCLGGHHGYGGAIILASHAALRVGAGLVRMASQAAHVTAALAVAPELMAFAVSNYREALQACESSSVIAIGPGLGQDAWSQALWQAALAVERPLVIDADAINLLATKPRPVPNAILTPHPKEAARLLAWTTAQVQADRFTAARLLVEQFGAVVVLKGAGTIVAAPNAQPRVICAGNPGMAVAGMGDVLTGIIAGLLAQGLARFEAASLGALIHACAGDDLAADQGERGLSPTEVIWATRRLVNTVRTS